MKESTKVKSENKTDRGKGARYALEMKRLRIIHIKLLKLLASENRAMPKQEITHIMNQTASAECLQNGGFFLSARLSELFRLGFVELLSSKAELIDSETMIFRHSGKPLWRLTKKGQDFLLRVREDQPETFII